jgi:RHS repeat-associated protein
VNGVAYTYDDNGNLLSDGVNTYAYDSANRLTSVNGTGSYTYNGLGDRLSQNGVNYTLDLNSGLTQVLSDGTTSYTYGLGRISQQSGNTPEYFLGDALGSVRQLVNNAGKVTLAKSYDPYGNVVSSTGSGSSVYAYTGEQQDASGLTYLRARYYNPVDGRFVSKDTWEGDENKPMSMNRWMYTSGNPINYTDPTGKYHGDVHQDGTLQWGGQGQLAENISYWDERVDTSPYLSPIGVCIPCHFMSGASTFAHIETAVNSGLSYLFGGALHQFQDYFSHYGEGYRAETLGHWNSMFGRSSEKLKDFFEGGHTASYSYSSPAGNGTISRWESSPFPKHPKEDLMRELRKRNPGLQISDIKSDWDLVDLYLRFDPGETLSEKMNERAYFSFDPDRYIRSSYRDTLMREDSMKLIKRFKSLPLKDGCGSHGVPVIKWLERGIPRDNSGEAQTMAELEIRNLLTSP